MALNSTLTNAAQRAEDARRRSAPSAVRRALPRIPLIPNEVLKQHNAFCAIDTRFRSAARLLQCIWVNTPPPKGGGFKLRLEAGLIDPSGR